MPERIGRYTVVLNNRPTVQGRAAVVGKREGEGPLARYFDAVFEDTTMGKKSWEQAESALQKEALTRALNRAGLAASDIHHLFCGDLLNQCTASAFGLREFGIPMFGQYGACSTMAQTIAMASVFVDSGAADLCAAVTSSHFCAAERQFRLPLEYGGQRPPSAQWTATAAGAAIIGMGGDGVRIAAVCGGRMMDMGITDANNMGGAMPPPAADTLLHFWQDTHTAPEDYDLVVTGDLSQVGSDLLHQLLAREGVTLGSRHADCGLLLYDRKRQDVHAGGSGCGCAASVLCGYLLGKLERREMKSMLFIATGALMSTTTSGQGESIPGIAHLVHFTAE